MAQVFSIVPRRAALWMGVESTFGTAASTTRVFPIEGSIELTPDQTELQNPELRPRTVDFLPPVLGLKGGTLKCSFWLRPDATQLGATTPAATPYLGIPLRSALGGEFPASGATNVGTTVSSGGGTAITLAAGHGARLTKGQFFGPQVSNVVEPAFVTNIATDVVTVCPAISSATATATTAFNAYNYFWTEPSPPSLTIEMALADAASQQWRATGCVCTNFEIELTRDSLIKLTFTYALGDWTGPGDLSLSVTQTANTMAAPQPMTGAQLILQAAATTTYPTAFYSAPEFKLSFDLGTGHAMDIGGTQGKAAVQRVGARPLCKATVMAYPDISGTSTVPDGWWSGRTALQCQLRVSQGSGATKRWCAIALPTVYLVGKPDANEGAIDSLELYTFELHSALNTLTSSPSTDQGYSPVVLAML